MLSELQIGLFKEIGESILSGYASNILVKNLRSLSKLILNSFFLAKTIRIIIVNPEENFLSY